MDWTPDVGATVSGSRSEYEILRHVDTGGFSEVFAARESPSGETVAIKTPNPDSRSLHADRFITREIRGLRTLDVLGGHRHAMSLREHVVVDGTDVLVVEFVDGDLVSTVSEPLGAGRVRSLGRQLADVLGTLHRSDLVYRDLKPDNMFITDDGLRLVDFNTLRPVSRCFDCGAFVAPAAAGDTTCRACGADLGPFVRLDDHADGHFKAPEQGDATLPCGPWVDVFAAGKLLHTLLTGFAPPGTDAAPDPDLYDIPPYLAAVIERATAADPTDRYRDATRLGRALADRTPDPGPPTATLVDLDTDTTYTVSPGDVLGRPTLLSTPDVPISPETPYVSREHLRFEIDRHQWVAHDRSTNGTAIRFGDEWHRTVGDDGTGPSDGPDPSDAADADEPTEPTRWWLRDGCVIAPAGESVGGRYRFRHEAGGWTPTNF